MIGNEFRARYVTDAKLFYDNYNVKTIDIQTPFAAQNIQSMQA